MLSPVFSYREAHVTEIQNEAGGRLLNNVSQIGPSARDCVAGASSCGAAALLIASHPGEILRTCDVDQRTPPTVLVDRTGRVMTGTLINSFDQDSQSEIVKDLVIAQIQNFLEGSLLTITFNQICLARPTGARSR